MRAVLHDGTTVVNVIEYDPASDYEPGEDLTLVELEEDSVVGPGWVVAGDSFAPPALPEDEAEDTD